MRSDLARIVGAEHVLDAPPGSRLQPRRDAPRRLVGQPTPWCFRAAPRRSRTSWPGATSTGCRDAARRRNRARRRGRAHRRRRGAVRSSASTRCTSSSRRLRRMRAGRGRHDRATFGAWPARTACCSAPTGLRSTSHDRRQRRDKRGRTARAQARCHGPLRVRAAGRGRPRRDRAVRWLAHEGRRRLRPRCRC